MGVPTAIRRANLEKDDVQADAIVESGKADMDGAGLSDEYAHLLHRGSGGSMYTREAHATREAPMRDRDDQPDAREGQAGRAGVAERFVVPLKPGNAGGGKGPQFKTDARRGEGPGDWAT